MSIAPPPRVRLPEGWYAYLRLPPWTGGADPVYEEVNGLQVEKKMGSVQSDLANALNDVLSAYVRAGRLGRSFIALEVEFPATGNRRIPDLVYMSAATWPLGRRAPADEAWWPITPDLCVESVSPSELTYGTLAKVNEYFAAGVKAVWLILPNVAQVYCYSSPTQVRVFGAADELTGDPVVPGFRMPLSELFPPALSEEVR